MMFHCIPRSKTHSQNYRSPFNVQFKKQHYLWVAFSLAHMFQFFYKIQCVAVGGWNSYFRNEFILQNLGPAQQVSIRTQIGSHGEVSKINDKQCRWYSKDYTICNSVLSSIHKRVHYSGANDNELGWGCSQVRIYTVHTLRGDHVLLPLISLG